MSPQRRRLVAVYLVGALALALVAQFYLAKQRAYLGDAVFLYGLASALFLAAVSAANRESAFGASPRERWWAEPLAWVRAHAARALLVGVSVVGVLGVGARATQRLTPGEGYRLLAVWALAFAAYALALTDLRVAGGWLRRLPQRLRANGWEVALVVGLTAVAGAARLTDLERIPFVLAGDEGAMGQEALNVLAGRLTNPFVTGWFSHPTLFFYLQAAVIRGLGNSITALRLLPALAGTLTVPALYLMARELFDRRVAFVAAAYLACYHYAVHFSRLGLNNAVDPLLAVACFYFLQRGLRQRRTEWFVLAGVALGLGQYFYMGSRVVPVIVGVWLGWLLLREPGFWRSYRWQLAAMAGAFVLVGWPLFLFFARHPKDFMARVNQLGIIQSGWLARTAQTLKRSQISILWEQFLKSALAFHYYPDPAVFYHPGMPLLDLLSGVPFTFGLVYSSVRVRERRHALGLFWFWGVIITGGVLLENPPSSQRIVLTVVPVSLFIAVGVTLAVDAAAKAFAWQRSSSLMIVALVAAGLGLVSERFYFGTYDRMRVYAGYNTEVAHNMGLYLRSLGPEYRFYFFGPPRMYAGFPSIPYLAPEVAREDVLNPLTGPPTFVKTDKRPVFIFLPERQRELEQVKLLYPSGWLREFRQPSGGLLFVAYEPN